MAKEFKRPIPRIALGMSEAAASIGVGLTSFLEMVSEGVMPPARHWHSRRLWLVSELETALSELPDDPNANISSRWANNTSDLGLGDSENIDEMWRMPPPFPVKPRETERHHSSHLTIEQRARSYAARLAAWKAKVPGSDLNLLECDVLEQLAKLGPNVFVKPNTVRRAGPATCETLEIRGFIKVQMSSKKPDMIEGICLTEAGLTASNPRNLNN